VTPFTKFSPCDKAQDFIAKQGLSFTSLPPQGDDVVIKIGSVEIKGYDEAKLKDAMKTTGYPSPAFKKAEMNFGMVLLILFIMVIYVTMVYGPIAAFLVELFPANIRYTSMSLPYHIGNGWFGGMLPLIATAWVAASGNIYRASGTRSSSPSSRSSFGGLFLRETKDVKTTKKSELTCSRGHHGRCPRAPSEPITVSLGRREAAFSSSERSPPVRLRPWPTKRPSISPFLREFLRSEAASGVLLLLAAVAAIALANSPWKDAYAHRRTSPSLRRRLLARRHDAVSRDQ